MKELEEVKGVYLDKFDITVDRYITPAIIETIAQEMLKCKSFTERELVKNVYLCKWATDMPKDYDYNKNYDLLLSNGVFSAIKLEILNVYDIDEYVAQATSINTRVGEFLDKITKSIDEYMSKLPSDFDMNKALSFLEEQKNGHIKRQSTK